jgi:hypothetical protein
MPECVTVGGQNLSVGGQGRFGGKLLSSVAVFPGLDLFPTLSEKSGASDGIFGQLFDEGKDYSRKPPASGDSQ